MLREWTCRFFWIFLCEIILTFGYILLRCFAHKDASELQQWDDRIWFRLGMAGSFLFLLPVGFS